MNYTDFVLRARDWDQGRFQVEVTASPVDRTSTPEQVSWDQTRQARRLRNLARKRIRLPELIELGRALASALLPPGVRSMLLRSLAAVGPDEGLRLRLVLDDPPLADLPWEYLYLARGAEEPGRDNFLVLDPRLSLVRHEAMPAAPASLRATRPLKMVVGLSAPRDTPPLDLEAERNFIAEALADVQDIQINFVANLTLERLEAACQGSHIFHFAGHGGFAAMTGSTRGGTILLEDDDSRAHPLPAENLALTLRGAGVRVAILGACESGRRDGVTAWSGVAAALMRVGLPGAVAMQYQVYDESAIAFARRFYQSLATGLSLDETVAAGRLGVLNAGGPHDVDWGVPVLYMRAHDGVIFPEVASDASLAAARETIRVTVRQRVAELSGRLVGVKIEDMGGGAVEIEQELGTITEGGKATGAEIGDLGAGDLQVDQKADRVDSGGTMTGAQIDKLG